MPQFGKSSMAKLMTCHRDIQVVMLEVIKISEVDFGVTHGIRTPEEQLELFKKGRHYLNGKWVVKEPGKIVTHMDGTDKKSRHNHDPARAVDIAAYVNGKYNWDPTHLTYLAGVIMGLSSYFKSIGKVENEMVWGANWDDDGELVNDHTFIDMPHFQI